MSNARSVLEEALLAFPQAPWEWPHVSANPAVSFSFILDHPELPWLPQFVSRNPSVTRQDVEENPQYPWHYGGLCSNPNLGMGFFEKYMIRPDAVRHINWSVLSANPAITHIDVLRHPEYPWNDRHLSSNPNINSNFVLNEGKFRNWSLSALCANPGITDRDIFRSSLQSLGEWDYNCLSCNPNLPIAFVDDNLDKPWNLYAISKNVSLNDIRTFRRVKWNGEGLSLNKGVTLDYVRSHQGVAWHGPSLATNPAIGLADIMNTYQWLDGLCGGQLMRYVWSNPNISLAWMQKHERSVDWSRLSRNSFTK